MLKEQILFEYACGSLSGAHSALVAAYLTMNPGARSFVKRIEMLGGEAIESNPDTLIRSSASDILMQIDKSAQTQADNPIISIDDAYAPFIPAPLKAYATEQKKNIEMKPFIPGYSKSVLTSKKDPVHAEFLQIDAGKPIAEHTHRGMELTLILDGAFDDESGHYSKGDLVITDETVHHKPISDINRGCFCFTTRSEPLKFTGAFGGLMNMIFRR